MYFMELTQMLIRIIALLLLAAYSLPSFSDERVLIDKVNAEYTDDKGYDTASRAFMLEVLKSKEKSELVREVLVRFYNTKYNLTAKKSADDSELFSDSELNGLAYECELYFSKRELERQAFLLMIHRELVEHLLYPKYRRGLVTSIIRDDTKGLSKEYQTLAKLFEKHDLRRKLISLELSEEDSSFIDDILQRNEKNKRIITHCVIFDTVSGLFDNRATATSPWLTELLFELIRTSKFYRKVGSQTQPSN